MSSEAENSVELSLRTPLRYLKGVGSRRADQLARIGLVNVQDLLFCFPRSYEDMSELKQVDELVDGEPCTVVGVVAEVELKNYPNGKSVVGALMRVQDKFVRALWFNQPFMQEKIREGTRLALSGKPKLKGLRWEIAHPRMQVLQAAEEFDQGRILPVYPLTQGISQMQMRRLIEQAASHFAEQLPEVFPAAFLDEQRLLPIVEAIRQIHMPSDQDGLKLGASSARVSGAVDLADGIGNATSRVAGSA